MPRRSLQSRILTLVAVLTVALVGSLGAASYLMVRADIARLLEERLLVARACSDRIELALDDGLRRLGEAATVTTADPAADLASAARTLRRGPADPIFGDGLFLLDANGGMLAGAPAEAALDPRLLGAARQAAMAGIPGVSNLLVVGPSERRVVAGLAPLRGSGGAVERIVGGDLDLTGTRLARLLQSHGPASASSMAILDAAGKVLASTAPDELFEDVDHRHIVADLIRERRSAVVECHGCHQRDRERHLEIMALTPLAHVPWAVAIRQDRRSVLRPAIVLRNQLLGIGAGCLLVAIAVTVATVGRLVRPIEALGASVRQIAGGNLERAVPVSGDSEVGELGRHIEAMRLRLRHLISQIREWNHRLEGQVASRTHELSVAADRNAALYQQLQREEATRRRLLHKVIAAQEAERKRIARELHDSTSQELVALGLRIDSCGADDPATQAALAPIKALAADALEGVHRMIFDLRPVMLDDLGLASALRWLCGRQLAGEARDHRFEVTGEERRLQPELETTLFRVAQEALGNVARHAQATHVLLTLTYLPAAVALEVQDDGVGFDPEEVVRAAKAGTSARGLGLLGMRERVELWDGRLEIDSAPQQGCRIEVRVPCAAAAAAVDP